MAWQEKKFQENVCMHLLLLISVCCFCVQRRKTSWCNVGRNNHLLRGKEENSAKFQLWGFCLFVLFLFVVFFVKSCVDLGTRWLLWTTEVKTKRHKKLWNTQKSMGLRQFACSSSISTVERWCNQQGWQTTWSNFDNKQTNKSPTTGIRYSRGQTILFADADGATEFNGLVGLEKELQKITKNEFGCVVSSRYLCNKKEKAEVHCLLTTLLLCFFVRKNNLCLIDFSLTTNKQQRSFLRKFVSKTFHTFVMFVCDTNIKDTYVSLFLPLHTTNNNNLNKQQRSQ